MCLMPYYAETHQHNNLFDNRRCSPRVLFFGEILHPSDQNTASFIQRIFIGINVPKLPNFKGFLFLKSPNLGNSFQHVVKI
jgi:hypothetical protein